MLSPLPEVCCSRIAHDALSDEPGRTARARPGGPTNVDRQWALNRGFRGAPGRPWSLVVIRRRCGSVECPAPAATWRLRLRRRLPSALSATGRAVRDYL